MVTSGPPSIQAIWYNITSGSGTWSSQSMPLHCPIDAAICQVTLHIQQGLYSIVSLSASEYSLTSTASKEEFRLS
jgi:hypothetical protein